MSEINLPTNNQKLLLKILTKALIALADKDERLFDVGVHEQAFSHRLALYIEKYFQEEFSNFSSEMYGINDIAVDCEYNRHGHEQKNLADIIDKYPDKKTDVVRPDIVLHVRGGSENLLVVEVTRSDINAYQYALDKVTSFVNSDYAYELGAVVKINSRAGTQSPFVRIGTVRRKFVTENNHLLLSFINSSLEYLFDRKVKNSLIDSNIDSDFVNDLFADSMDHNDYTEDEFVSINDVKELWSNIDGDSW